MAAPQQWQQGSDQGGVIRGELSDQGGVMNVIEHDKCSGVVTGLLEAYTSSVIYVNISDHYQTKSAAYTEQCYEEGLTKKKCYQCYRVDCLER